MPAHSEPLRLGVVCEAAADHELATHLADRLLKERLPWLSDVALDDVRRWHGLLPAEPFLLWRDVPKLVRERQLRLTGKFGAESGAMDARSARGALLLFASQAASVRPHAVLLLRDTDGHEDRCKGLQQARTDPDRHWPFPIVIGAEHCKRESWILAGFEPTSKEESERLADQRELLGFHPCERPELLAASDDAASSKRSAKKVLAALTDEDRRRESACYQDVPLELLRKRGTHCGLANFLAYVEKRLVPLLR